MQKIVSYAGQSVDQNSTEHSQERRLKDAHKQENRQPEDQQHNSVSDRFRRVLPFRNGSSFEQPSLDSPVQSIFLESESWLLFNPCFFHEIFRKDSSCFFFIEVIANEVFGDVLSFCHLQPDAASGMALQEGSQIV